MPTTDPLYIAPKETPIDHEELRQSLTRAWMEIVGDEPASDAISILIAQSALETGRWAKCMNYNLGGIKSAKGQLYTTYMTHEIISGIKTLMRDNFRAWHNLDDAAKSFVSLLHRKWPLAIAAAQAGDVDKFVHELKTGQNKTSSHDDYFTASEAAYVIGVRARFDEYREPCLATQGEVIEALYILGYRSFYAEALMDFQKANGLLDDGVLGSKTRAAIRRVSTTIPPPEPTKPDVLSLDLHTVRGIQSGLKLLGFTIAVDGVSGPKTKAVIMQFQKNYTISVDGVAGEETIATLTNALKHRKTKP